jgi:hypothetical protein
VRWPAQSLLQDGNKRLSAGEKLALLMIAQHRNRFGNTMRREEFEIVHPGFRLSVDGFGGNHSVARHYLGRRKNRLDDIMVARATADVAFQAVADVTFAELSGAFMNQVDPAHDHARRTKAALQTVMLPEHRLQGMKLAIVGCHPFDGRDRAAARLPCKHRTGFDGITIDKNHARTTLAGVATHMRSGQSKLVLEQLDQKGSPFDVD